MTNTQLFNEIIYRIKDVANQHNTMNAAKKLVVDKYDHAQASELQNKILGAKEMYIDIADALNKIKVKIEKNEI